ncbi:MAG: pilus assembly protein [Burkholderiaceae bacterium]
MRHHPKLRHRLGPPRERRLAGRVHRGIALVDTLVAVPLVLWLGLAILQWALVFHGRNAVSYALLEASRTGSVAHAETAAIDRGLARGLVPYLYGASNGAEFDANLGQAAAHVAAGKRAGWIEVNVISPDSRSFSDWGEPARDDEGQPVGGSIEIPIDSLRYRAISARPATGIAGYRGQEPIGAASGQTLADALLLKVELVYGVPLTVPLVGPLSAWIMRQLDACESAADRHLGLVRLASQAQHPRQWACRYYDAVDERGQRRPRWPVRLSTVVRMQSPPRMAE